LTCAGFCSSLLTGIDVCIKHQDIFKQEVMAVVIQQLVDQVKLPTLFMRTVLSSVKAFPNLAGFTNGILTRLVSKKVWTNLKLWEGFIRCCSVCIAFFFHVIQQDTHYAVNADLVLFWYIQLTAPTSFSVLITLPKAQLEDILRKLPGLKPRLYEYLMELPPSMRVRVKQVIALVEPQEEEDASITANAAGGSLLPMAPPPPPPAHPQVHQQQPASIAQSALAEFEQERERAMEESYHSRRGAPGLEA
jgi:symplekin